MHATTTHIGSCRSLIELGSDDAPVLDPRRRVFVNRDLRLDQIGLIGFDMDYTLADYHRETMEELSFRLTVEKLIADKGYPAGIAAIRYDPHFVVRGLTVDKRLGNIFKMDRHKHVGRVYHGRRELAKEERRALYRRVKIRLTAPRYHWIDTLFSLPEACLFAELVDYFESSRHRSRPDYWQLFCDIRDCIDRAHRDGSLKAVVQAEIARFVRKDPELAATLHRFRSTGKKLFLLTNSHAEYTCRVMAHLLDGELPEYPSWRHYFDYVVVGADKPRFFTDGEPFREVDEGCQPGAIARSLEKGRLYHGGNQAAFEKMTGLQGERVLYVGDHIYGDIIRSKKETLWRTALILRELEEEVGVGRQLAPDAQAIRDLDEQRSRLDHEILYDRVLLAALDRSQEEALRSGTRSASLERTRRAMRHRIDEKRRRLKEVLAQVERLDNRVDREYNLFWGSVFKEGREMSLFGGQVGDYACIYTSRVSNFLAYSPLQYFRSPRALMAHETG